MIAPTLALLFALALAGVGVGLWLAEIPDLARWAVPFSGGLLTGIALFWILPETAEQYGWLRACGGLLAGFAVLWLIDRSLYPVSTTGSAHPLHGFGVPLLAASAMHSFFDGWSVAVSQQQANTELKAAFLIGIGVHKIPEGLALGVLLLAATGSIWKSLLSAAAVQSAMWAGALVAVFLSSRVAPQWSAAFLAAAAGVFVYLGYHAIEGPVRDRGLAPVLWPALSGAAGAAILRLVPGL